MDLLTYNLLYDLYVNKRMSCEEIANFLPFSISWLAIRNKLLNYEIEIRGHGALPSYFKYKEETKAICPVCSKEFIKNLKVRKTCSRSCGSKLQFL